MSLILHRTRDTSQTLMAFMLSATHHSTMRRRSRRVAGGWVVV